MILQFYICYIFSYKDDVDYIYIQTKPVFVQPQKDGKVSGKRTKHTSPENFSTKKPKMMKTEYNEINTKEEILLFKMQENEEKVMTQKKKQKKIHHRNKNHHQS